MWMSIQIRVIATCEDVQITMITVILLRAKSARMQNFPGGAHLLFFFGRGGVRRDINFRSKYGTQKFKEWIQRKALKIII